MELQETNNTTAPPPPPPPVPLEEFVDPRGALLSEINALRTGKLQSEPKDEKESKKKKKEKKDVKPPPEKSDWKEIPCNQQVTPFNCNLIKSFIVQFNKCLKVKLFRVVA